MRSYTLQLTLTLVFAVSACATGPQLPQPQAQVESVTPVTPDRAGLVGLTTPQLLARLGNPALQVREGTSLKLQFRDVHCVIDAYLYPAPGNGAVLRVEHVDARVSSGAKANEESCVAAFRAGAN